MHSKILLWVRAPLLVSRATACNRQEIKNVLKYELLDAVNVKFYRVSGKKAENFTDFAPPRGSSQLMFL